eukprot:5438028-Lingulodinium_polyedra.AAC.1
MWRTLALASCGSSGRGGPTIRQTALGWARRRPAVNPPPRTSCRRPRTAGSRRRSLHGRRAPRPTLWSATCPRRPLRRAGRSASQASRRPAGTRRPRSR